MGTFGEFNGSTNASQDVAAGTVKIRLGSEQSSIVLDAVGGILPGDSAERFVTLANEGTADLNSVKLTTALPAGATANALTLDATNGLKLTVESCSQAWTVVANAADTCDGTTRAILTGLPIIGADRDLGAMAAKTADASDYLKITTSLPAGADNTFQSLNAGINFTFTATQRTGSVS